jgi:predicted MFS family arabinose efflux permease
VAAHKGVPMLRLPRSLTLVYLVVVATYAAEGFITVVLPPYLQSQGVPLDYIGAIVAALALASLFSRLPAGLLYRPRRANVSIAVAGVAVAAATFLYPRTDNELALGALRLLHGFAFGVSTTLNMAQFFDVRPPAFDRGRAMGLFAAAIAAGNMLGNFIGGWWADHLGFESAFTAAALFPLLAAAINLQVRHEPARAAPAAGKKTARGVRATLAAMANPGILLAALLLFCLNLMNQMFVAFFTLYALGIGLTLTTVGSLRAAGSFGGIFTRVFAGELGRFWTARQITRVGITASAVVLFLIPTTTVLALLAPLTVGLAVLRSIVTVTGGVNVIDATEATAEQRGMASGLFNMGKDLGALSGPLFGGLVSAQVGVAPMMQLIAVAALLLFWLPTLGLELRQRRARAGRLASIR